MRNAADAAHGANSNDTTANARTRRVWYGHGSSRLVADTRALPAADVIDEAIAGFNESESNPAPEPKTPSTWRPVKNSIVANLNYVI